MKQIAVLLGAALLLCSCGTQRLFNGDIYRVDRPWWDSRETYDPPEDCRDMLDLATYMFPRDNKATPVPVPEPCRRNEAGYRPSNNEVDEARLAYVQATMSAEARDRLQDKLLALSNRECDEHHAAVVGTNAGTNFGLATLTSLFSGGATAFAAKSTKSVLAAISTFLGATRSHLNETVYRQLFVGTILQAINDDRQAALLNIYDKRRYPVPESVEDDPRMRGMAIEAIADDDTEPQQNDENENDDNAAEPADVAPRLHYSIDEAIRDAENYHDRCSFYQGLVRVAVTVQEASPCVTARQRRDQILDEIAAIQVTNNPAFQSRINSLQKELEKLETKVLSCIDAAQ